MTAKPVFRELVAMKALTCKAAISRKGFCTKQQ